MKVKLLVSRCGPVINQEAGEVVTVSDDEGKRMIAAGQARPYKSSERAVNKDAVETADK